MRKLRATVFNYSLDGLLADEGTEFWKFVFDLPEIREPDAPAQLDLRHAPSAARPRRIHRALQPGETASEPRPSRARSQLAS
jgi:hypothetical protein